MDLEGLRTFRKVAEEKSFCRAAEVLHLTQPSVTARIQSLELQVGQKLFTRRGRRTELTEAGRVLLPYVEGVLSQLEEARARVAALRGQASTQIMVGATRGTGTYMLPPMVAAFTARHPSARVVIRTAANSQVVRMVLDEGLDVGIAKAPFSLAGIEVTPLFEDDFVMVVRPEHHLARAGVASLACLRQESLICYDSSAVYWKRLERLLEEAGLRPRIQVEVDQFEAVKELLRLIGGVTFVPRSIVRRDIADRRLVEVPLADAALPRTLYIALYRTHQQSNPLVQNFVRSLQEWFRRPESLTAG